MFSELISARTVLLVFGVHNFLVGLILLIYRFVDVQRRVLTLFAGGTALTGLGLLMLGLRELIPAFWSVHIGNAALVSGYVLMAAAYRRYAHRSVESRGRTVIAVLTALVAYNGAAFLIANYGGGLIGLTTLGAVTLALYYSLNSLFLYSGNHAPTTLHRLLLGANVCGIGLAAARVVDSLVVPAHMILTDSPVNYVSYVGLFVVIVVSTIALLLLMKQETDISLADSHKYIARLQQLESERERMHRELLQQEQQQTIGNLAGGVAHDSRKLLGILEADLTYLYDSMVGPGVAVQTRNVLDEMKHTLRHARVLAAGLLSLDATRPVVAEPIAVNSLIENLWQVVQSMAPESIALRLELPQHLVVHSNPTFLQSALLNLFVNAVEAMPNGGELAVTVRATEWDGSPPLSLGSLTPGRYAEVAIADSGDGMPAGTLSRAFQPRFSTKQHSAGHGLGLYQVAQFVERSDAGLSLESSEGRGTTFRLLLPLHPSNSSVPYSVPADDARVQAKAAPAGAATQPSSLHRSGSNDARLRILIVEDDPRYCHALIRMLKLRKITATCAANGCVALEHLAQDAAYDLVLSDVAMPCMDGIELCRRLHTEYPQLPVLLMTGQDATVMPFDTLPSRPPVLDKPLSRDELLSAIATATAGSTPAHTEKTDESQKPPPAVPQSAAVKQHPGVS